MILISSIIFLINFISFMFLIRYGNMIVIIIELVTLTGLTIYILLKNKKNYTKFKYISYLFLLSIIQFIIFLIFNKYGWINFPNDLDGALNSIITIILFFALDIVYIIIFLASNLIKLLLNKMNEEGREE